MPDVRDLKKWEALKAKVREYAASMGMEYQETNLANGKQTISFRVWYVPKKPKTNQGVQHGHVISEAKLNTDKTCRT